MAVALGLMLAASVGAPESAEAARFFDSNTKKWVTYKSYRRSGKSPAMREMRWLPAH